MTLAEYDRMSPKGVSVVMAFDAFRVCLGGEPKTFTAEQIIVWIKLVSGTSGESIDRPFSDRNPGDRRKRK